MFFLETVPPALSFYYCMKSKRFQKSYRKYCALASIVASICRLRSRHSTSFEFISFLHWRSYLDWKCQKTGNNVADHVAFLINYVCNNSKSFLRNTSSKCFVVTFEIYFVHYHCMLNLISAAVPERTLIIWCTTEVINIERAAVSHLNVLGP